MKERPALAWLRDARQHALDAHDIARSLDSDTVDRSRRDRFVLQFCLAVVGEALNEVPKDVQALEPKIPWRAIYNLRNRLIHGFWLIDTDIVLDIAHHRTKPLVMLIDSLIEKLET